MLQSSKIPRRKSRVCGIVDLGFSTRGLRGKHVVFSFSFIWNELTMVNERGLWPPVHKITCSILEHSAALQWCYPCENDWCHILVYEHRIPCTQRNFALQSCVGGEQSHSEMIVVRLRSGYLIQLLLDFHFFSENVHHAVNQNFLFSPFNKCSQIIYRIVINRPSHLQFS